MAVNSSSSTFSHIQDCSDATGGMAMSMTFFVTNFSLLLPLCILVLYLGYRRWRQQRSFATTSHSDIFTYHFAAMELIYALGATFYIFGMFFGLPVLMTIGYYASFSFYPGQTTFHILTCVERYLAVVHPVTYLGLRQSGGVRIRNISIGCAWLTYCGWIGVEALYFPAVPHVYIICALVFASVVVSFCSVSVLCVLIRPGPGEMGGNSDRVDPSKQRAFNTIIAITGVQWLFFMGVLVCVSLSNTKLLRVNVECLVMMSGNWFSLPSSLVLPLLFLHRAGKLVCCN